MNIASPQEVERHFGPVTYSDDQFVVRTKVRGTEVTVYAHKKVAGRETFPPGYMPGANILKMEIR